MIVSKNICENMHVTQTEILNAVVLEDGSVDGFCGSDAFYCMVCGSSEMTQLAAMEVPSK